MNTFLALAEPNRLAIIELLASSGQLSASDISKKFLISASAVSQHLKVLRESKLVHMEKRAQQRLYQINPASLRDLELWANQMMKQYEERFEALDEVLKAEKNKLV